MLLHRRFISLGNACFDTLFFIVSLHLQKKKGYWKEFAIGLSFIITAAVINISGAKYVGTAAMILIPIALIPFLILIICGFTSEHFDARMWIETKGQTNLGFYFSVLIWCTCGFEHSGFFAEKVEHPNRTYIVVMTTVVL